MYRARDKVNASCNRSPLWIKRHTHKSSKKFKEGLKEMIRNRKVEFKWEKCKRRLEIDKLWDENRLGKEIQWE